MKTIKKVPVTYEYVHFIPETSLMEEGKIYISGKYGTAVHLCLCGCKNLTVTPLNSKDWTLTRINGKITMQPSIGNFQFPCKSHYIITNSVANFV